MRESRWAWLLGALLGVMLGLGTALAGPLLFILAAIVLGSQLLRMRSAAYVSGACIGLGVGWLTMPLFGLKVTELQLVIVGAALLLAGAVAGVIAIRRVARPEDR